MGRVLIGAKVRERRKALAITQAALAARLGISPSYLTLIEGDRRNIGGTLLQRIAQELGTPLDEFGGAAQRRLADAVAEVAADPLLATLPLDPAAAAGLASREPGWAQALVRLHRAYGDRSAAADALADRLRHDPVVADTVHRMLTQVSAIRSAAEILEGEGELDAQQRRRFVAMVADDSRRLSDVSRALAGFFTAAHGAARAASPAREVDDFLAAADNHFPALEEAAAALHEALGADDSPLDGVLAAHLQDVHGVRVLRPEAPGGRAAAPARAWFDAERGLLEIPAAAPRATACFALARTAGQLGAGEAIAAALAASPQPLSAAAQVAARHALASYFAGALLMPYERTLATARALRYDIDALARRFHVSFEQACHRLATLRRPGAAGVRFGFLRCDAAGRIGKRLDLPHLPLPAQWPGCPLWPLFLAFQAPGAVVRQLVAFPGGDRYLMVARAVEKAGGPAGLPRQLLSVMLVCDVLDAGELAYGDGLDLSERAPAVPVGQGCRVCPRRDCTHRQEEPLLDALATPQGGTA